MCHTNADLRRFVPIALSNQVFTELDWSRELGEESRLAGNCLPDDLHLRSFYRWNGCIAIHQYSTRFERRLFMNETAVVMIVVEGLFLTAISLVLFLITHCNEQESRGANLKSGLGFWAGIQYCSAWVYFVGAVVFAIMAKFASESINHWLVWVAILVPIISGAVSFGLARKQGRV
ncbi:MAG: hypothetical protein JW816_03715 [Candidatus Buchananbacteria bacterium]|nr:hypothetical protein [Candidatus Buchananbacteria bacterium]